MMKIKFLFFGVLTVTAMSAAFWLHANARPQDRKIRVWVFRANDQAGSIAQSVEAKFNSTMRYETADTMQTDLILLLGCLTVQDNTNSLRDQWVCSSTLQVVAGELIAVPHDAGNNLVIGSPEFVAQSIFEKAVSHSGDRELQAKRDFFQKETYVYCKRFNCSEEAK